MDIVSYWDIIDTDLQDYIIKIRDDMKLNEYMNDTKHLFKVGMFKVKVISELNILKVNKKSIKCEKVYPRFDDNGQVMLETYKFKYDIFNKPYITVKCKEPGYYTPIIYYTTIYATDLEEYFNK